ncbi:hypothetical protein [Algoriphagus terrigena]|uniref:hypothetical protein n=1 Tax=Algoriphagus terrigena TaxID=344884 RepID=UPI00047B47B9|nr:hypothetical protein [Algoriphagus terrigena]
MNKLKDIIKNITPKKLVGIQIIYLSIVGGLLFTIGNQKPGVLYKGKIISLNEAKTLDLDLGQGRKFGEKHAPNNKGEKVFNKPLVKNMLIYLLLIDGIFVGYWFIKRG